MPGHHNADVTVKQVDAVHSSSHLHDRNSTHWDLKTHHPVAKQVYVRSLYWALASMTNLGYSKGCPIATNDSEYLLAICCQLTGAILYAIIFSNVAGLLQKIAAGEERYVKKQVATRGGLAHVSWSASTNATRTRRLRACGMAVEACVLARILHHRAVVLLDAAHVRGTLLL